MLTLFLAVTAQAAISDVVVSAKRLEDASVACRKGACTPLRDAQVSIAWAEHQFRQGAYVRAKRTLADALGRNRRHAATAPRPVAALYEAYATVSLQEGDMRAYRLGTGGRARTLQANLPANDPEIPHAELALGDMWVKLGDVRSADLAYQSTENRARARGQHTAALVAALRRVWLASARGAVGRAETLLAEAARQQGASDATIQAILPVVRLRLAAHRSDDAEVARQIGVLSRTTTVRPQLVWAPNYTTKLQNEGSREGAPDIISADNVRSSDLSPIKWADVGFWIRPDGRTAEIEVLRGTPGRGWLPPVINQIAARRYTSTAGDAFSEGSYRIERFSFRGTYVVPVGSLIRRRAGPPELEVLDLTAPDPSRSAHR